MELHADKQSLMKNTTTWILALGAVLGVLADLLLGTVGPFGLGFLIWTVLFAAALGCLTASSASVDARPVIVWSLAAVSATILMLYRSVPIILLGLLLVMAVSMAMIILHFSGRSLPGSNLSDHFRALIGVPLQGALGAWPLFGRIDLGAGIRHPQLWSGLRGALLALPLLLVFILLFSSADASFDHLVSSTLELFSTSTLRHLGQTLIFAWLVTGLLASVLGIQRFAATRPCSSLKLATTDTAVLMGSLVILFLVFVTLQLSYLFGGRETIVLTSGLTLAQYARRGFFELLTVAGLTLMVLISVAGSNCNKRVFRPLAAVLIACVLIIQMSALQRLFLYIDEFGLTIDRLTALAVMVWIVVSIGLFAGTLLRGTSRGFAAAMTISGVITVFFLALSNPGALVTRVNIERSVENQRELDIDHLLRLGSDAVPMLIENLPALPVPRRCQPVAYLYANWYAPTAAASAMNRDWRAWNYSKIRGTGMIEEFEVQLKVLAKSCLIGNLYIDNSGSPQQELLVHGRTITATSLYRWIYR